MRILNILTFACMLIGALAGTSIIKSSVVNNCITFTVSQGTGCEWMCNYCSNQLGTDNYYFQDGVCKYQTGGCVGNPIAGKSYTCCTGGSIMVKDEI